MPLYIIATPIGNLRDMSPRARDVLRESDLIVAEDTRRTRTLLSRFDIHPPEIESVHAHTDESKREAIVQRIVNGTETALVTDGGTPGVSDPGSDVVRRVRESGGTVTAVPGPSAVTAALSIAGFPAQAFCFRGYPPKKRKRGKWFARVAESPETQVLFSTPHRIDEDLSSLREAGISKERQLFIARELTKQYESVCRGNIEEVIEQIDKAPHKGEFTIVIAPLRS